MVLLKDPGQGGVSYRGGYVSIGNFDGVHLGHRKIAERVAALAAGERCAAVVLTFDPHPLAILRADRPLQKLTTVVQKVELLEKAGIDCVIAYPTDRALLALSPEEFFDAVVVQQLHARGIVEGPNFCFGKDRAGDLRTLQDLCSRRGLVLDVVQPVGGEQMVSSSAIRAALLAGRFSDAFRMLGHPYRLSGEVVTGARRGASLGFPTANLANVETLVPADGVYAGGCVIDGQQFAAAVNIGPNPTFGELAKKVEVHLSGFSGDLYGRSLGVDLIERVRDTRRFDSRVELIAQIERDVAAARLAAAKFFEGT